MDESYRDKRNAEVEVAARDSRLNKLTETLEKQKSLTHTHHLGTTTSIDQLKQKISTLESDARTKHKQMADMATLIEKQMQLIQLLRKQKLHAEAAHLLNLTEEQFASSLNSHHLWVHRVISTSWCNK